MSSFHRVHDAYQNLYRLGDQRAKLSELVDFETFRESLEACWWKPGEAAKGGRPPWNPVMMFKILLIGIKTGASDEKFEYMVTDSLTLNRFLGLDMDARAPDHDCALSQFAGRQRRARHVRIVPRPARSGWLSSAERVDAGFDLRAGADSTQHAG